MKLEKQNDSERMKELPSVSVAVFEKALSDATAVWQKRARFVDQFEDDRMELSFAKGFLAGAKWMLKKKK